MTVVILFNVKVDNNSVGVDYVEVRYSKRYQM